MWNEHVEKYLESVLLNFTSCRTTGKPRETGKVSLSSIIRSSNEVVCVDHIYLENHYVIHITDSALRYYTGAIVEDRFINKAITAFEAYWITPFWNPSTVVFDRPFENIAFTLYLTDENIEERSLPPRRHNKEVLESKHKIIQDILQRLKTTTVNHDKDGMSQLNVQQSIRIWNDLYDNGIISAHELDKGYPRPIKAEKPPKLLIQD